MLFELPDVGRVLREAAFWDIYYEHCSYFTPGSLARLFRRAGFDVLDLELDYDDQYIVIEARVATGADSGSPHAAEESVESLGVAVEAFGASLAAGRARWGAELAGLRAEGGRAVVWGAGSKAVAFLTTLGVGPEVEVAVDVNPFKQDMFMAGTGHRVVAPEALRRPPPRSRRRDEPDLRGRDPRAPPGPRAFAEGRRRMTTSVVAGAEVPFLDLRWSHEPLAEAILLDIAELIESSAFINGPAVARFEERFAAFCGSQYCVGTASGLDALRLALLAAGLEPGDEVIVPAQTFVATLEAVTQAGGRPVLADVRDDDYGLDVDAVERAIGSRTRAVMPVHLFGQMADLTRLGALASAQGLALVEDACQAHGATRDALVAGAAGLAGAFSFYPGKNLGAMGDAGALVTDDEQLATRVRALREHGQTRKYEHEQEGYTARLDTMQAAVLLRKLPLLDGVERGPPGRRPAVHGALRGVGDLRLPQVSPGSQPVWHLYVVRTADPAALGAYLAERGIGTGRHYPKPAHLSTAYAGSDIGRATSPSPSGSRPSRCRCPSIPGSRTVRSRRSFVPSAPTSAMADRPANDAPYRLLDDVSFGDDVIVQAFTNLYGCHIGVSDRGSERSWRSSVAW